MTDRHKGYIVTLNNDIREDDAEYIINALRMVSGVLSVEPVVSDVSGFMDRERAWYEIRDVLFDTLVKQRKK